MSELSTLKLFPVDSNEDGNDFQLKLALQDRKKVKDICHIQGYRDIKSCTITFDSQEKRNRKIASLAANYALDTLGMEEVFLQINPDDQSMLDILDTDEFECLGDEKGSIIYLKEKTY